MIAAVSLLCRSWALYLACSLSLRQDTLAAARRQSDWRSKDHQRLRSGLWTIRLVCLVSRQTGRASQHSTAAEQHPQTMFRSESPPLRVAGSMVGASRSREVSATHVPATRQVSARHSIASVPSSGEKVADKIPERHPGRISQSQSYSSLVASPVLSSQFEDGHKDAQRDYMSEISSLTRKNRGQFQATNVYWASSSAKASLNIIWKHAPTLTLSQTGALKTPSMTIIENLHYCQINLSQHDTIVEITPWKKDTRESNTVKYLFRFNKLDDYLSFVSAVIVWSNLKPEGINTKWSYEITNKNNNKSLTAKKLKTRAKVRLWNASDDDNDNDDLPSRWISAKLSLSEEGNLQIAHSTSEKSITLYDIDIHDLFNFEVRKLHESVFAHPNVLFIGAIKELRKHHNVSPSTKIDKDTNVYIKFDSLCELQIWLNLCHSYTKKELLRSTKGLHPKMDPLELSQKLNLEIMEVQISKVQPRDLLYCELFLWDHLWFKSSVVRVDDLKCAFWKEMVDLDLPIGDLNNAKIIVKRTSHSNDIDYNASYELIDMYGEDDDVENKRDSGEFDDEILGASFLDCKSFQNDQILKRIPVTNLQNMEIGNIMINLTASQNYILPSGRYRALSKLLSNADITEIISYVHPHCDTTQTEEVSRTLLEAYECLKLEDDYFSSLMKYELSGCNGMKSGYSSRSLESAKGSLPQQGGQSMKFNTIFRGNSILSKSLERYTLSKGQEYLSQLLSPFIDKILTENLNCECDPKLSPDSHQENFQHLITYVENLWHRISSSTNDIPLEIKQQWKNLRVNVEFQAEISDLETPLNALSSFIFLRFICPAIMTPKLYGISINATEGLSGRATRTLMLVSKVLMVFSNRGRFQNHKDPYLMRLNDEFLSVHAEEMSVFYDKVTQRKMDFNERILKVAEPTKLNVVIEDESLRFARFADMISKYYCEIHGNGEISEKSLNGTFNEKELTPIPTERDVDAVGSGYQIEGFDDSLLEGNDFITSLINENSEAFGTIMDKHEFTIKDVEKQCVFLHDECEKIIHTLEKEENIQDGDFDLFVENFLQSLKVFNGTLMYQGVGEDLNEIIKEIVIESVKTREKERERERSLELERAKNRLRSVERARKETISSNNQNANGNSSGDTGKRSLFKSIFKRKSTAG